MTFYSPQTRHGFTVLELLGVISILGILMGLLLPAVQQAREAARRITCSSNLAQQGLALQNFESTFKFLPAGAEAGTLHSWSTQVLPYVEQVGLHQRIDFRVAWDAPKNAAWARQNLSVFACPSSWKNYAGSTDYCGISGSSHQATGDVGRNGILFPLDRGERPIAISSIIDGTTIHSATENWATVRTIDLPSHVMSAKWLGDKQLLTTLISEAHHEDVPSNSLPLACVVPINTDQPGELKPIREVVLAVALADGKRWIGVNRHSAFCMSLGNPEPLWEKEMESWDTQDLAEIKYSAWLNDPSWIAIEQRTSVGALTVLDLHTGIEVLRTKGYEKAFFAGKSIAEGYRVHRDNIRATGDDGRP